MGWVEILGGVVAIISGIVALTTYWQYKKAGRYEAELEQANRDREALEKADRAVRDLTPADRERLRDKWTRQPNDLSHL